MVFKGSHGTCRSLAEAAVTEWQRSEAAVGGTAVYFWMESSQYIELAEGWYRRQLKGKVYLGQKDHSGVVVIAIIDTGDYETLDLDGSQDYRALIIDRAYEAGITTKNKRELCGYFNTFYDRWERRTGHRLGVVFMRLQPPGKEYLARPYDSLGRGLPRCALVRLTDTISIDDVLEVSDQ